MQDEQAWAREQGWASAGDKLAQANATERLINAKESELQQCIAQNYNRVREVEGELAALQLQLKLTSGPKRSALELFRKKIEAQNACVLAARERHAAAKKVFEATEEALRVEERAKDQLCQELNMLVQQSAHAQIERLELLTQRLEFLNKGLYHEQATPAAASPVASKTAPTAPPAIAAVPAAEPGTAAATAPGSTPAEPCAATPPAASATSPAQPVPANPKQQAQQQQQQQQQQQRQQQRRQQQHLGARQGQQRAAPGDSKAAANGADRGGHFQGFE